MEPIVHRPYSLLDLREPKKPMATRVSLLRRVMRRFRTKRGLLGI